MNSPPRQPPLATDPLGEALHLLQLTGTLYCRGELSAPFGIQVPPLDGLITFQVVIDGRAWLEVEGQEPRLLERGSLTLITHGTAHRLSSELGVSPAPLFDIPVEQVSERYEILRYGGGGAPTRVVYGVARFDTLAAERLVQLLPPVLHLTSWQEEGESWLGSMLQLITREASTLRPGGETVITRLSDVIIIQAIRAWLDSAPEARTGWLLALRDPAVGGALRAMHRAPERPWTVASLAREARMSRSAFSARFTELVGTPALRYLTEWRLRLARLAIQRSPEPLSAVASRHGYGSEAAFSRAFSREFGVSPGSFRRSGGG